MNLSIHGVIDVLTALPILRGVPGHIRFDYGPELERARWASMPHIRTGAPQKVHVAAMAARAAAQTR